MLIPQLTILGLDIHKSGLSYAFLSVKDRIVEVSLHLCRDMSENITISKLLNPFHSPKNLFCFVLIVLTEIKDKGSHTENLLYALTLFLHLPHCKDDFLKICIASFLLTYSASYITTK